MIRIVHNSKQALFVLSRDGAVIVPLVVCFEMHNHDLNNTASHVWEILPGIMLVESR